MINAALGADRVRYDFSWLRGDTHGTPQTCFVGPPTSNECKTKSRRDGYKCCAKIMGSAD